MTRRGRRRSTSDTRRGASKVLRRVYPRGMLWDTPQGDTTSCTYGKIFRIRLLFPASAEPSFVPPAKRISQGVQLSLVADESVNVMACAPIENPLGRMVFDVGS